VNIFVLHENPTIAAQYQCDKHVPKMVLETAQLLCSAFPEGVAPYKPTHLNHPCTKWVKASSSNWHWLLTHGFALCNEYTHRFKKTHACERVMLWLMENHENISLGALGVTPFAQAMPVEYRNDNAVEAYRLYYKKDKSRFAKWIKGRSAPEWWNYET